MGGNSTAGKPYIIIVIVGGLNLHHNLRGRSLSLHLSVGHAALMITILRMFLVAPGTIIVGGARQGTFTNIGNVITIVICIFVAITAIDIDINIKPSTCSHGDLRASEDRNSGLMCFLIRRYIRFLRVFANNNVKEGICVA